jgi:hypothetical protein
MSVAGHTLDPRRNTWRRTRRLWCADSGGCTAFRITVRLGTAKKERCRAKGG